MVEILVAIGVLVMILLLIVRITSMTNLTVNATAQRAEAGEAARIVLDRIGIDWDSRLRRSDVAPFSVNKAAGNDSLWFYSAVDGFGGVRPVTMVAYAVTGTDASSTAPNIPYLNNPCALERGIQGLASWTAPIAFLTPTLPQISNTNDYQTLSPDVFRMEVCWQLNTTGTAGTTGTSGGQIVATPPSDPNTVGALIVTIAVLDKKSRRQAGTAAIENLISNLADAQDGTTPLQQWSSFILSPTFQDLSQTPAPIVRNLRFYQRYYYAN
jgi:hypothetical protein